MHKHTLTHTRIEQTLCVCDCVCINPVTATLAAYSMWQRGRGCRHGQLGNSNNINIIRTSNENTLA